jgi:hypothetical protein
MSIDPQSATGRTMPARAPVAPRTQPAAAKPPNVMPPMASTLPTSQAPSGASRDLGPAEGTHVPVAFGAPAANPENTALTSPETFSIGPLSNREYAFVCLLRDLDQITGLGTFSPLERAAIAGAKAMLDQLSLECERMLARKLSDIVGPPSKLAAEPDSVSSRKVAAASDRPRDNPTASPSHSRGVEPAGGGSSLIERLERLEGIVGP